MLRSIIPFSRFKLSAELLILMALACQADSQPATHLFDVSSYGAIGNGTTNDARAIQSAIDAAAKGGVIYFPAGTYLIDSPISDPNLLRSSLKGSGVNATTLLIGRHGSLTISAAINPPYHGGTIEDFTVQCQTGTDGGQAGIITQDASAVKWRNIAFSRCGTGIDMQDVKAWTERDDVEDVTFFDCKIAIHFDRLAADPYLSYGYNYFRIWVNTDKAGTIFLASGGANPYNSFYGVMGNIAKGTIVFDAHSDGHSNSMYNNTYFVQLEDQGTGPARSYIFDDHNAGGPNGEIHGIGQLSYGPSTSLAAPGSVSYPVNNLGLTPADLGTFTTSANTYDVVANNMITPSSACFVQPENSVAASLTNVYISSVAWSRVVINHPARSGAVYRLWCHP